MSGGQTLGEKYYLQVSESIQSIFELTTRVDERVQIIMKKQEELDHKLDKAIQQNNALGTRITILESTHDPTRTKENIDELETRVQTLENKVNAFDNKWKNVVDFIFKFLWTLLTAFVLFRLGWNPPVTP